ncbi:phage holin [Virgibacillus halodenitrificans]|uniref:phage holin n=1 Tax=Virgibacillus halodenitrificans TaxID=1482 RepID=UPI001FB1DC7C|nr:phage holin [Virgibacillus halodenitrificans]MCJ0932628.1 phage holin [Virgibacillus halodenitrificans]
MKINWKVRLKNKTFWLAIVPALLLVAQIVSGWFGYDLAADLFTAEATKLINAVFVVLMLLGIVNDPTVSGASDSKQALNYKRPRKDDK